MRKHSLKSGMNRVCIISLILLCSVIASQNAFSALHWRKDYIDFKYDKQTGMVTIVFVFYEKITTKETNAILQRCIFKYSEDDVEYKPLVRASTESQEKDNESKITFFGKTRLQYIRLYHKIFPSGVVWEEYEPRMIAYVNPVLNQLIVNGKPLNTFRSSMKFLWKLPVGAKPIKFLRFEGDWKISDVKLVEKIKELYTLDDLKRYSNVKINTPLKLMPEISNNVKITKDADAINVTGAVVGENIEVYTQEGVEVKSVVSTNDVVTIKLPKKQKYIVKIGTVSYKVVL